MSIRSFMGACGAIVVFGSPVAAQFTAVVAPPRAKVDTVAAEPATIAATRDSVARVTMTNMREWVDSAAVSLGVRTDSVRLDSVQVTITPPVAAVDTTLRLPPTEAFREGARAPDTATPFPLVAIAGALLLLSGVWLLRRREPVESPARR